MRFTVKIRFETTIDDVIAFNRFHFAHSPAWRRQVWTQCLILPGLFGAMLLFGWWSSHDQAAWPLQEEGDTAFLYFLAAVYAVCSIAWIVFIRWYMNSSL